MRAQCRGTSPEGTAAQVWAPEISAARRLRGPAVGAVPTWHCDPGVAWGGHGDFATPCISVRPLGRRDRQFSIQGSQGHRQDQTRRGGQGGVCARGGGRSGRSRGAAQRPGRARASEAGAGSGARGQGGLRAVTEQGSVPPRSDRRPARSQRG